MQFQSFDKFQHEGEVWLQGVLSGAGEEQTEEMACVLRAGENQQVYVLKAEGLSEDGKTVTEVGLFMQPQQEGVTLQNLPAPLRENLAEALERVAGRAGQEVDASVLEAVREGRDLAQEQEAEAEFTRLTRNLDHDLEAAYINRDALKEKALTALDEGRDDEAKAAMEQLGEVQQSIKDYWNPNKPRPLVAQPLSEDEQMEVEIAELTTDEELSHEAAGMAIAHFGKEAADALSRGDVEAHDAAIEKVRAYQNVHQSLDAQEEEAFAQAEKDAEGTEYAVEEEERGGHAARLREERSQPRSEGRGA